MWVNWVGRKQRGLPQWTASGLLRHGYTVLMAVWGDDPTGERDKAVWFENRYQAEKARRMISSLLGDRCNGTSVQMRKE